MPTYVVLRSPTNDVLSYPQCGSQPTTNGINRVWEWTGTVLRALREPPNELSYPSINTTGNITLEVVSGNTVYLRRGTAWLDMDSNGSLIERGAAIAWTQTVVSVPVVSDLTQSEVDALRAQMSSLNDQLSACEAAAVDGSTFCRPGTTWTGSACAADPVDGSTFCAPGTTWNGSACAAVPVDGSTFCAPGTTWNGSACAAVPVDGSTFCAPGTTWNGSACAADAVDGSTFCGTNTTWTGSSCKPSGTTCSAGTVWDNRASSCSVDATVCGTGTTWDSRTSSCSVGATVCGTGTTWNGSSCSVDDTTVCGTGTTWNGRDGVCVANCGNVCGSGTSWDGTACVATDGSSGRVGADNCGTGTTWDGTACVSTANLCSTNTEVWDGSTCVQVDAFCAAGTVYSPLNNQCEVASTACATSTYFGETDQKCFTSCPYEQAHCPTGTILGPLVGRSICRSCI